MKRALLTLVAVLAVAAPAQAANLTVTTTNDGGGSCPPGRLPCTLRAALNVAAQNSEADVITVPAGTYRLSANLPELTLSGGVSVVGAGAATTRIESSGATRVFGVNSGPNLISDLTIAGGRATTDVGGNVETAHGADVVFERVRVTGGIATRGGGIATGGGGTVEIRHSLIDGNTAQPSGQAPFGDGGGIYVRSDNPQILRVSDTTIAFNRALRGAGLFFDQGTQNRATLTRLTVADNTASGTLGGGLLITDSQTVEVQGSIFARNTGNASQAAQVIVPSNCGPTRPTTMGGNVESASDCGFELQNTVAGLATTLTDEGGPTPVLALPWESVAHDLAGPCSGSDQRGVARPQGAACDPGAFEAVAPPPPAATPTPEAQPPVATPTPTPTVVPVPTPVAGRVIVAARDRGTVLVKPKGAKRYEPLDAAKSVPVGSTIDARKGRVRLTSIPRPGAPPETAVFYAGIFRITQARGITDLKLVEALAACPRGKASSAAKKPKKRRLWGDGKGSFRTSGKYSAATVRGTKWLVEDSCAGTLTRVTQGSVTVRHGKRTIVVRAGKRYLARARR